MSQSYSNHKRYVPGFHFATSFLIVVALVISLYGLARLISSGNQDVTDIMCKGVLPVVVALVLVLLFWYTRKFATVVQDRAVRAEEQLRHYMLSGKPLDARLTKGQIVALRFAPDEEFLALCRQSADDGLSPDEVKKAIKTWKADHHRV